jgi:hypothetical protein
MSSKLEFRYIEPPNGGIDEDSPPDRIPKGKAQVVENLLTHRQGLLVQRGRLSQFLKDGFTVRSISLTSVGCGTNPNTTDHYPSGIWAAGPKLLIAYKDLDNVQGLYEPWQTPQQIALQATQLAEASATTSLNRISHYVALDLNSMTTACFNRNPGIGLDPRFTRVGQFAYGFGYGDPLSPNDAVNQGIGSWHRDNQLIAWDSAASLGVGNPTFYAKNVAPHGGQDVKLFANRLFVLGGVEPGKTHGAANCGPTAGDPCVIEFNTLYFSQPLSERVQLPAALAQWQDPVTGITNRIGISTTNPSDYGVALARIGQSLAILNRFSISLLHGYSPATFTLRTITNALGCIDPRSVVEVEGGVFFMSQQGYVFFDGAQVRKVSEGLDSTLLRDALDFVDTPGHYFGVVSASKLPNDYLLVTVGRAHAPDPGVDPDLGLTGQRAYLYHTRTGAWSTFKSPVFNDPGANNRPVLTGNAGNITWAIAKGRLYRLDDITIPERSPTDASSDKDYNGATATHSIFVPWWLSRAEYVGSAGWRSLLHRLMFDYKANVTGASHDTQSTAWTVAIGGIGPTTAAPAGGELPVLTTGDTAALPTYAGGRRRAVADVFLELDGFIVQAVWNGVGSATLVPAGAEVYGMGIEFQGIRESGKIVSQT